MEEEVDILKQVLNFAPQEERKEEINLGFFDQYQFDTFIRTLDQRSDIEVMNFLKVNLEFICNRILSNEWDCPDVLISDKFMRNFSQVLTTVNITHGMRVAANKICYDYLTSGITIDDNVKDKVLRLSRVVNYAYIQQLVGVGLDEVTASNLVLCRFSSIKEKINIRRLNFVICTKDPEVMTTQMIVYIYEKLFDRVGELFEETMWEYYTPDQEVELGNDFLEIYSTVSLAILTIVNNMPMASIEKIITGYVTDWEYIGRPPTRFSLISLSADYNRIQLVVEALTERGIYVP